MFKKGDIVEFWLRSGSGGFDPKIARWQIARVADIIDHVVMIVPWHCGHEMIINKNLLKHTTLEKWEEENK